MNANSRDRSSQALASEPPAATQAVSDEQWYDIASRHACSNWSGNDYLELIKSVGKEAILAATQAPAVSVPPAASEPAGWKLVPIEPTREMEDAGGKVTGLPGMVYRRMIAAAPSQQPATAEPLDDFENHVLPKEWRSEPAVAVQAEAAHRSFCDASNNLHTTCSTPEACAHPKPAAPATAEDAVSEGEVLRAIQSIGADGQGRIALTYESGPYDIDKPTNVAMRLSRAILALRSGASAQPADGSK